jgi:hypothetical protein
MARGAAILYTCSRKISPKILAIFSLLIAKSGITIPSLTFEFCCQFCLAQSAAALYSSSIAKKATVAILLQICVFNFLCIMFIPCCAKLAKNLWYCGDHS